jgi:hypothetical protein
MGIQTGKQVRTMNAVMNGARSKSTVLTAAAGLLLLLTAVVMMVCAAPRVHAARGVSVTRNQLASWVWVTRDHPVVVPVARTPSAARP